jgi:hypothetical protein
MAARKADDDRSLKRLGGGRWQTRDERFTIEPQSGTWVLVDAEQTDDLGLPLVRGPFRSLTDAKAAVDAARGSAAPESPLAGRVKESATEANRTSAATTTRASDRATPPEAKKSTAKSRPTPAVPGPTPAVPEPTPEPRWIADLSPRDRGRARRLIEALAHAGVRDAENVVRQDLTGGVPTLARVAIADRLAALLPAAAGEARATEKTLVELLATLDHGGAEELGVRWKLVDDENRLIGLTATDIRAAIKRRTASDEEKGKG